MREEQFLWKHTHIRHNSNPGLAAPQHTHALSNGLPLTLTLYVLQYSHTNTIQYNTIQSKTLELISWIQVLPQASNDWIHFFFLKHAWKQCSASLNAHNAQQWKYKTCASIYKRQNQFILVHTSYLAKPSKTNWDQIFACLNLNSWWGKVDTVRGEQAIEKTNAQIGES